MKNIKVNLGELTLDEWNQIDEELNRNLIDVHITDKTNSDNIPKFLILEGEKAWVFGKGKEALFNANPLEEITFWEFTEFLGLVGFEFKNPFLKDNESESNPIIPDHYKSSDNMDVIDVCKVLNLNFNRGNVLKYIARAGKKDDELQDLNKALEYLKREIKYIENKKNETGN